MRRTSHLLFGDMGAFDNVYAGGLHARHGMVERAIQVYRPAGVLDEGCVEAEPARIERRESDAEIGRKAYAINFPLDAFVNNKYMEKILYCPKIK